jgi:hypothetical protein
MSGNKKRKKTTQAAPMTPKRYIMEKGRSLPIINCLIHEQWRNMGMASIFVVRGMPSGNLIIGSYLVDTLCLGLKNTMFMFNLTEKEWTEKQIDLLSGDSFIECSYELAHTIIYGGIDFAEDAGFRPQKDFAITKYLLAEDVGIEPDEDVEFGKDGTHYYVPGPNDQPNVVLNTLNRTLGKGNYLFTVVDGEDDYFFEDDYDVEWVDEEVDDEAHFEEAEEV